MQIPQISVPPAIIIPKINVPIDEFIAEQESRGMDAFDQPWEYTHGVEMTETELSEYELYNDAQWLHLLEDRQYMLSLPAIDKERHERWGKLHVLREEYADFKDFLFDCMTELLGFTCSDIQEDIAEFLQDESNDNIVIHAQRSQAKSTIIAIYGVWKLIHNPKTRILIVSAGSDVATEIANWAIQIIREWDILECLRPDKAHGDRASTKAFDVHWQLKYTEKSPSIACIGITANMQGRRADILIADDIESSKNGLTETQRAKLVELTKDFPSICGEGRIIYAGTPQSIDSIYKDLPARGYKVRIWTGRYPTPEEIPRYDGHLAPLILERIALNPALQTGGGVDGTRGQVTDRILPALSERRLQHKELDQGPEYFQLQHMLDTTLTDAGRYPLRLRDLVVMDVAQDRAPGAISWLPNPKLRFREDDMLTRYRVKPELYIPFSMSEQLGEYEFKMVHVDPSGDGSDELAVTAGYTLNGYAFIPEILALQGGHTESNMLAIAEFICRHQPNVVEVESNSGHGAFAKLLHPVIQQVYTREGKGTAPMPEDVWESVQKEKRICDTLSPVMARHRLIISPEVIEYDWRSIQKYPVQERQNYSLLHQLARITREKGSLVHDDRLDSLHATVRRLMGHLSVDEHQKMIEEETDKNMEFMAKWGAYTVVPEVYSCTSKFKQRGNL